MTLPAVYKQMAKIAIIGAVEQELLPLSEALQLDGEWERLTDSVYVNKQRGIEIFAGVVGVGKVNSAYRIAEIVQEFSPELIINIGFAGGMLSDALPGDIIIGTDYRQVDFVSLSQQLSVGVIPGAAPFLIPEPFIQLAEKHSKGSGFRTFSGRIATGDFFLNDNVRKAEIVRDFAPAAFDMESAAIAHVCAAKAIPFVALRVLSDLANDEAHLSVSADLSAVARRPVQVALQAINEYYGAHTVTPQVLQDNFT